MCILSLVKKNNGFLLTHNRDEDFQRKASDVLSVKLIKNQELTFPMDSVSKGTWIMTSSQWTTAILNGALIKHKRNPPYKHSRGNFPFLLAEFNDVQAYIESLELNRIEPFTQIIMDNEHHQAYELMWNGKEKMFRQIEEDLYVTCSATLYSPEEKRQIQQKFKTINDLNADNLAQLHQALSWTFKPELPMIKTTSMVQILQNEKDRNMNYKNYQ